MRRVLQRGQVYAYTWGDGYEEIHLLLFDTGQGSKPDHEQIWCTFRLDNGESGVASFLLDDGVTSWRRL